jgi:hypothetical protein
VSCSVREPLANDPQHGLVDHGGDRRARVFVVSRRGVLREAHLHPGSPCARDKRLDALARRLEGGRVRRLARQGDDFAKPLTRANGRFTKLAEPFTLGSLEAGIQFERPRLHGDQGEFVTQGVVQIVGDARPLVGLRPLGDDRVVTHPLLSAEQPIPADPPRQRDPHEPERETHDPVAERRAFGQSVRDGQGDEHDQTQR